ncbi:17561_t:CDS:2 [Dentiscutata erythropus]|uniref:17561_t:CDS:1 n=1 Tax=Dentiscutata erythropus TaxID=1348616 RepID=A0A9N9G6A4_9GLOM|nr:17561_t:CDS:2 [Dentiscutata erythropus]
MKSKDLDFENVGTMCNNGCRNLGITLVKRFGWSGIEDRFRPWVLQK